MAKKFTETKIPSNGSNRVSLVKEFLNTNYDIKINIFDNTKVMIASKSREYDQEISIEDISLHMLEEGITGADSILKKILTSPNQTVPYNPIKEYFQSLEGTYGGESHIDLLCTFLKARDFGDKEEENYYQKRLVYTFRKWLVATVACAMGEKANDAMFVVVNSDTGIGKSGLLEYLVPDLLKSYYTKSVKDMSYPDMFTTNLLIQFDEMVGLTRSTAEEFKNILSSLYINVSKRFTSTKQRYASACGTTNKDAEHGGFIHPDMSLRRFAVNHIDEIDWEGYTKVIDVDQIWAEAYMLLSQNFEYTWNKKDFTEFEDYNSRFLIQTSSFRILKEWYRAPEPGEEDMAEFKQPVEILRDLKKARKVNASMTSITDVNIGIALRQLMFVRYAKKVKGQSRYGYDVIPLF
ncbi:VapE domain-containing protein [uncultured Sunxiuqinia sp.]|uniref:VapE domain-containing protein n=1 Tax=uncultured Sunxiuqinia sp. TaxID=1573825 RepID=UPI002623D698|nr:VapE domain-containing protein [uncultured Sunxiuqinia sp.]